MEAGNETRPKMAILDARKRDVTAGGIEQAQRERERWIEWREKRTLLCDLTEEVATREKVHDEELVGSLLDASLKRDDTWVLGYELVEAYFT